MTEFEKAIEYLEPIAMHPIMTGQYCKHLKTALTALREKAEPENKPLTLDELRKMDGEPVWVEYRAPIKPRQPWGVRCEWGLVYSNSISTKRSCILLTRIGVDAMAYRSKPKEEV